MNQKIYCVACESQDIKDHGESAHVAPNGEYMHIYECEDCGQCWRE